VAALLDGGYTCREVAEHFQIGVATVVRIGQRQRKTGSADSKPMGGARHDALGGQRTWLRQRVREAPDLTLQALRAELSKRGLSVSLWTIWFFRHKEGLTFKKVFRPASSKRPVSAE
jgi:transposase